MGERAGVVCFGRHRGGRGAWVCIDRACLSKLDAKALSRALRKPVGLQASVSIPATVATIAEQRVYGLLGLARRQGALVVGYDNIKKTSVAFLVVANDASAQCRERVGGQLFGSSSSLGRCTGLHGVSVLGIVPGSLARQAAYWLTVWYESCAHGNGCEEARN